MSVAIAYGMVKNWRWRLTALLAFFVALFCLLVMSRERQQVAYFNHALFVSAGAYQRNWNGIGLIGETSAAFITGVLAAIAFLSVVASRVWEPRPIHLDAASKPQR